MRTDADFNTYWASEALVWAQTLETDPRSNHLAVSKGVDGVFLIDGVDTTVQPSLRR